ncbi:mRNA splicing protein PRP46 NDAI_0E02400 [Naumovozyma dairenensis CBS 421]|uniref:Pre-mRNA-splicing factor PRP46 n=1 Tax=Naumovozyma dairenensis (strain ATCC 10597 / BCRC 20456 / CBS 421 / NBRC 0211 / NRRL Y-12639) TaxID=1071378 RepID=G0WBD7_NAUDC|nr:hypothetical protein NDAI_0E02400 [Naumovozyma dairenensis CBS 421]CCD25057.1 hypothetical protein NDAI_0E02400 [Naumovozyma dairenensis CBS 421]
MDNYGNYETPIPIQRINDYYSSLRWRNQFSYMERLPQHLKEKVDSQDPVLQRYRLQISEGNDTTSQDLAKVDSSSTKINATLEKTFGNSMEDSILGRHQQYISQRPEWHAPWKLKRVINGHLGWVRCVAVDPIDNEWFVTGSNDATIKIWDLAKGHLKLTLAGHAMTVRDIAISERHPYMFSASEDKLVKCWDLEKNTAIRDYHGHLSGVHSVDIHPTLDLIATAGRDSVVRLWDIRARVSVMTLIGHKSPINKVHCLPVDPQIVSCSTDATIRLWDIIAGKSRKVLTHHKKSVRDMSFHPREFSMVSASTDDIRSWRLPEGALLTNFNSEKSGIINSLSVNQDNVLCAGGDNGTLSFYDYKSGHKYQTLATKEIPGSLGSERGILCSTFDQTGLRLITGETDKSIKIWHQDDIATPETNPGLPWNPKLSSQRF